MIRAGDFGLGSPIRAFPNCHERARAGASSKAFGRTTTRRNRSALGKLFGFLTRKSSSAAPAIDPGDWVSLLSGYSLEVMPKTLANCEGFETRLPADTRVYVAHIDGTEIQDMVSATARISAAGFAAMPHIPARSLSDAAMLDDWLRRYRDAGATQALILAGGRGEPRGAYRSSMELLETGLFDKHGFERLHVAGHPEGNKDIDADGSERNLMDALRWKQKFSERTGADMAIVTQFAFEVRPVIDWAERMKAEGIHLPIHLGIAGPTKLQTMIRFAMACGAGPSVRVLQRRASDISNLLLPYEPTDLLRDLMEHKRNDPDSLIEQVHFFPFGGIVGTVEYARSHAAAERSGARSVRVDA